MRHVSALMIRVEFPLSCTRKYNALPNEKKINPSNTIRIILINSVITLTIRDPKRTGLVYSDMARNAP